MKKIIAITLLLHVVQVAAQPKIVVDITGGGHFKKIQDAINSLPDSSVKANIIFIKNGIYHEKLFVKKSDIIFEGESREKTVITHSIARDEWRCNHKDDWGVATMNVMGNDITLKNLTITNSFGFEFKSDYEVDCAADSTGKKTITIRSHQMALRTMNCTRLRALNCHFKAFGGDTVSPWEVENGMWYFKDCIMEGGVDFYCPRGWAWAENCEFITHTGTAAIWHDGSANPDAKTVLMNCRFKGFDGFLLGRYHRDAQFYLINCVFGKNMKDAPIYRVATGNELKWGERVYYYNCSREAARPDETVGRGKNFKWYKNNLPAALNAGNINVNWVFGSRWNPEKE